MHITQSNITDYLSRGESNGVSLGELASMLNIPRRTVQRLVTAERLRGVPICSSELGYYLPLDDAERANFVRSMRSRAREILAAADAVARCDLDTNP